MNKIFRRFSVSFFVFLFLAPYAHGADSPASALARRIADAYRVKEFDKIDAIQYTFNVITQNGDTGQRSWEWKPKTGEVHFKGKNAKGELIERTYIRGDLDKDTSTLLKRIDHGFINDQYWLLFPFHLAWDSNVDFTADGTQPLPIPPGNGEHLLIEYGKAGGYTPGDAYELFVDSLDHVKQWVFHHGGMKEDGSPITWQHIVQAGPILIATEHYTPDGKLRLWFTDIAIKLNGGTEWIKAQQ